MKSKVLDEMAPLLNQAFGQRIGQEALSYARQNFDRLCTDHADEPKAVKAQTHNNLYPCMALYQGLQKAGVPQPDALQFLDRSWSLRAQPQAASIRALLKIPGLYKLMPRIYKKVTLSQFGEAAGFRATFYSTGPDRCKFDMTQCLYCDLCRKNGCPELVPCFCHTDDVTTGNMHPRILWNRTKTMSEGGDVCDFDILITKK